MAQAAKAPRHTRTLTVAFHDEATYAQRLDKGKTFIAFVLAFMLSIGLQLNHTSTGSGGGLTRHSPSARVRLGRLTLWRMPCTRWKAVCTVLPPCVLRYRTMRPETARDALVATHGGLRLERCAASCPLSPMALSRLVWALGPPSLVAVLTRWARPLPVSLLADAKHRKCLTDKGDLPTIVRGRVRWHLGDSASKSAVAFPESYGACQRAARAHEPSYQVRGALPDGFDSTVSRMRPLFPGARLGSCLRHALNKFPDKLIGVSASVRQGLRSTCHALLHRCRPRTRLRVVAWGQRLRHCADRITAMGGEAPGARVRQWCQAKKAGWYPVRADPQMPAMSTVRDQAHNAIDRTRFAMQGFHHPGGRQAALLTGLAPLDTFIPSQRRALNAGTCGVAVEGGRVPTADWMLNLQILTSGGYQCAPVPPHH